MRLENEVKTKLNEKRRLIRNIRESLSADLTQKEIDNHPAMLAQGYCVRTLEWVLKEIDEI